MLGFSLEIFSGNFNYLSNILTFVLAAVPGIYIFIQYSTKDSFQLIFEDKHQSFIVGLIQSIISICFFTLSGLAGIILTIQMNIDGISNIVSSILNVIFALGILSIIVFSPIYTVRSSYFKIKHPKLFFYIFIWEFYSFWYIYGLSIFNDKSNITNAIKYINSDIIIISTLATTMFYLYLHFQSKKIRPGIFYKMKQLDYNVLKRNDVIRLYTMNSKRIILTTKEEVNFELKKLYYVYELDNDTSYVYTLEDI